MEDKKPSILIVDDNLKVCQTMKDVLNREGYDVSIAGTRAAAMGYLEKVFYNIVLIDLKLPDCAGLDMVGDIRSRHGDAIVIIITGFATVESAVSALNAGVFAYIPKPVNIENLTDVLKKGLLIQKLSMDNKVLLRKLEELSVTDTHTELYNYRYFMQRLEAEFNRARRYMVPLSLIMLDIDYFKSINDVYGHSFGDEVLKEFACFVKKFTRLTDVFARFGGEEFVILLTDTNTEGSMVFADRLLDAINKNMFGTKEKNIKIKVSMGLSHFPGDAGPSDMPSALINCADKALMNAKETGGDKYVVHSTMAVKEDNGTNKNIQENIKDLKEKLGHMLTRTNQSVIESIYAFAKSIEAKDKYTQEHSDNMVELVQGVGRRMGLSEDSISNLKHAATLHDLGKIGVPDHILLKQGSLTSDEYDVIKKHPAIGAEIIRPIFFLRDLVPIILFHHERFDGRGYLAGLIGKQIPLGARIVAVADVYQALTSDRPYRKAYSASEAIRAIKNGAGSQFDPEVVSVFIEEVKTTKPL